LTGIGLNFKKELIIESKSGLKISSRIIEVLKRVEQTESLNTAIKEMDLSYSYTWNTLYKINCQFNTPLIETKGGGLASVTESGKKLIRQYDNLKQNIDKILQKHVIEI
jgi:molybdate transport repressor ModE-like protein